MPTRSELDEFFQEHHRALACQALRLCRTRADADDLLQATYERSIRRFASFQPGTNGARWLATIMNRLFVDGWRRQRRAPVALGPEVLDRLAAPTTEESTRLVTDQDVRRALDGLPLDLRRLVEGHVYERLSYATLAARLGVVTSTVGSRLHRSRRLLRAALQRVAAAG
jgi:RNA polymerase sigma-70 factor (ECF subfamily)